MLTMCMRAIACWLLLLLAISNEAWSADPRKPVRLLAGQDLGRTFWRLAEAQGTAVDATANEQEIVLHVNYSFLLFSSWCQEASLGFEETQNALKIYRTRSPSVTRQRSCKDASETVLDRIAPQLPSVSSARLDGLTLTFLDAAGSPLARFARFNASGLEFHTWTIASYFDGKALVPTNTEDYIFPQITLMHGRVHGTAGCGMLMGSYYARERDLSLEAGTFLRGHCPDKIWTQVQKLDRELTGEHFVELGGDRAVLRDKSGITRIVLSHGRR